MPQAVDLTADASVAAYAIATWLGVWASSRRPRLARASNAIYAFGSVMMLVHIGCAYGMAHDWSHTAALAHTAEETHAVVGVSVPAGLYVNFMFAAVYVADAVWRFRETSASNRRPRALAWSVDIFLASIVVMATAVFESGPVRWATVAAIVVIGASATLERLGKRT